MNAKCGERALVIGASSGIARAVIEQLLTRTQVSKVDAVSRSFSTKPSGDKVEYYELDSFFESHIKEFIAARKANGITYRYIVCAIGFLHNEVLGIKPEKRLEDIQAEAMKQYFAVNTIIPTLWLKNLPAVIAKNTPTTMAFFSARVGSISDNRLGGWYGYRASKSALNMVIKNAAIEYARRHKQVTLMAYHPGTVDTGLSKPFQANVPQQKLFTPAFSAQCLVEQLTNAQAEHSPYYVDWDAQNIPW